MRAPYRTFQFDWLISDDSPSVSLSPADGDVEWLQYPIPPELGKGGFQKVDLALNMSIFRAMHQFTPNAIGQLIPLAGIQIDFPEETFMAQVVRGGSIIHREKWPQAEVLFSPGLDLFRLTDKVDLIPVLDRSHSTEMTCLTMGRAMLSTLIGEEDANRLMSALCLIECPQVVVRPIPDYVSKFLHGSITTGLVGTARRLYCQARMLDYLAALINAVLKPENQKILSSGSARRAGLIREYLTSHQGKHPSLDELSIQFGGSSKKLNDEFVATYGESIFSFITSHKLHQAHAAIVETGIPLKRLAEKLGYAHVSNFTIAFKRKFGYPPGSLRRR